MATLNEAIPNQAEQGAPIVTSPTCSTLPTCMIRLIGQYSHFSSLSTATFGAGITVDSIAYISPTEVDATDQHRSAVLHRRTAGHGDHARTSPAPISLRSPSPMSAITVARPALPPAPAARLSPTNVFSIIPGPAIISSVAPATGNEGQEVVFNITGEQRTGRRTLPSSTSPAAAPI